MEKNTWILPRNKRTLIPVSEILSAFHLNALNQQWSGDIERQIRFENTLEKLGIKRSGPRRDQGGSGARTYEAWLACLGLIFVEESTGLQRLTIAGDILLNGAPPRAIITDQLLKFQYPSSYSKRQGVNISERFKVHPFRFILSLLQNTDIEYLKQEEIALIVITDGDSNSDDCIRHTAERIKAFRTYGYEILSDNFCSMYPARTGIQDFESTKNRLNDLANTFINFIEYSQLAARDSSKKLRIINPGDVKNILAGEAVFIDQPENQEYFQRRFGLAGGRTKDTRSFGLSSVSSLQIQKKIIEALFFHTATRELASSSDSNLMDYIVDNTGCSYDVVHEKLSEYYGREAGIFESEYFRMSLAGKEKASDFEKATTALFGTKGFGFKAEHIGSRRLHPDVYVLSSIYGFSGIIDNKAYASYSISNDHMNRMLYNYIPHFKNVDGNAFSFFVYIAGGFKSTFNSQVESISRESNILGSGINASNIIKLLDIYKTKNLTHRDLQKLFTLKREISLKDIDKMITVS